MTLIIIIHYATWIMEYTSAAVIGPNLVDIPIRLADANIITNDLITKTYPQEAFQKQNYYKLQESTSMNRPLSKSSERTELYSTTTDEGNRNTMNQNRVVITEPSTGDLLEGNKFVIGLKIQSTNETQFRETYIENKEGRICLSLDQSPYVCWPPIGRMFFTQATEGEHEIVATLWRNGLLEESTTSERISFTTIFNPKIIQEESHDKVKPQHSLESHSYRTNDNMRRDNVMENRSNPSNDVVNVTYPIVHITSPLRKVSYPGESLFFDYDLPITENQGLFKKYFQTAFVCINVDIATAFSCFPIFGLSNNTTTTTTTNQASSTIPWLVGLSKGMHTIEAMLSHPETGDLLPASSSGTIMFFMAGAENEGAAFIGSINIRGKRYDIPIMRGGCLEAQTQAFCRSIAGLSDLHQACMDPVLSHLQEVAVQVGFVSIPC